MESIRPDGDRRMSVAQPEQRIAGKQDADEKKKQGQDDADMEEADPVVEQDEIAGRCDPLHYEDQSEHGVEDEDPRPVAEDGDRLGVTRLGVRRHRQNRLPWEPEVDSGFFAGLRNAAPEVETAATCPSWNSMSSAAPAATSAAA